MMLREFRREDAPRLFALLKSEFPEEEAMLGMRPEGFETVIRRLYRADVRFVLGLLRAFHRSPFHLYVAEEGGAIAATTLLSFAPRAGFLSTVVVDPAFRRHGFARRLLQAARGETGRRGRPYVALRVLESNTPARALYASEGYVDLDRQWFSVQDAPATIVPPQAGAAVRPSRPSDLAAVAALANRLAPEPVRTVLPVRPRYFAGGTWDDRLFSAETAHWVVDRGRGPEAHVAATTTPTTEAAHLSTPIVAESVEPSLAADLVRTAGVWLATRRPPRIVTTVPETSARARAALKEVGFHDAVAHRTLYRPSR